MTSYVVSALEWEKATYQDAVDYEIHATPWGAEYLIFPPADKATAETAFEVCYLEWGSKGNESLGKFPTIDEAKIVAAAHYESQLMNSLEPSLDRVGDLIKAVEKLPVEEWIQADDFGDPELIGYVMQSQGEWDNVVKALRALKEERGES